MKKIIVSSLMLAFLVGVSPVSADGGMMPISNNQPAVTAPTATGNFDELINKLVVGVLQLFTWTNDEGEISFTDTNYSVQYDCNTIFGTYSMNRAQVNLSTPGMTLMACADDAMDADKELVTDLSEVKYLTFKDGKLVMTGKDVELSFDATLTVESDSETDETDYIGMTVDEAEAAAEENDVLFRVVKIDGEEQATTRDFRIGRINAVVESDIVTAYTVESEDTQVTYQALIGMTVDEAEDYTKALDVEFRIGTIDGEGQAVTSDFVAGRITAETKDGKVIDFTVE